MSQTAIVVGRHRNQPNLWLPCSRNQAVRQSVCVSCEPFSAPGRSGNITPGYGGVLEGYLLMGGALGCHWPVLNMLV